MSSLFYHFPIVQASNFKLTLPRLNSWCYFDEFWNNIDEILEMVIEVGVGEKSHRTKPELEKDGLSLTLKGVKLCNYYFF